MCTVSAFDPGFVKMRRRIVLGECYCLRGIAATHLRSIFDQAAREARMPFYAVASPSRFHTTKTQSGRVLPSEEP